MPQYLTPTGQTCSIHDAMSGGRLKAGFCEIVADGERVHANIFMMDQAPGSGRMYLTDSAKQLTDAEAADAAYQRSVDAMNDWRKPPERPAPKEPPTSLADAAAREQAALQKANDHNAWRNKSVPVQGSTSAPNLWLER